MQIRVPIWSYFYHQVEIIIWAFAPCIARIVHWKLWLVSPPKTEIVWNYVQCSKQKVQKLQIAYFCGFLRIFADYLRTFASFLRTFCLWFGAFGDQHTAMFTIRRKKLHVFLSLGAGRWDHAWIVGRMSRNDIFCVCICSKKLQNMLVSLIHGTEFIGLTLNVVPQAILITHV